MATDAIASSMQRMKSIHIVFDPLPIYSRQRSEAESSLLSGIHNGVSTMRATICNYFKNKLSVSGFSSTNVPLKLFAFVLLALSAQPAAAGVNLLLKVDGVAGESVLANHEDEIDLLAWAWSVESPSGSQGTGRRRAASCSGGIEVTKSIDLASAPLLMAQLTGRSYPEVVLTVQNILEGARMDFLTLTLSNVTVDSMAVGMSTNGDTVHEKLTFVFESMVFAYSNATGGGQSEAAVQDIQQC